MPKEGGEFQYANQSGNEADHVDEENYKVVELSDKPTEEKEEEEEEEDEEEESHIFDFCPGKEPEKC